MDSLRGLEPSVNPDTPIARVKFLGDGAFSLCSAWELAAKIRSPAMVENLNRGFGLSARESATHAERLGRLLVLALKENAVEARIPFEIERDGLRWFVAWCLSNGAELRQEQLSEAGVGGAWLAAEATRSEDGASARLIRSMGKMGLDLNPKADGGTPPLHAACRQEKGEALASLLDAGVDLSVRDEAGASVEDLAAAAHPEMFGILKSWRLRQIAMDALNVHAFRVPPPPPGVE